MAGYLKPYAERTLKTKYRQLGLDEETVSLLHRYFSAFANLYGILSLKEAYYIINRQNPKMISFEKLYEFSSIVRREKQYYYIVDMDEMWNDVEPTQKNREIVAQDILAVNEDLYYELISMQKGKPLYIPAKSELLKYEDELYYERTPYAIAVEDFLKNKKKLSDERLKEAMTVVKLELNLWDKSIDSVFESFKWMKINFAGKEVIDFNILYSDMSNHFHMQCNRGFTPHELSKLLRGGNKLDF